jgi:hypothetical protein
MAGEAAQQQAPTWRDVVLQISTSISCDKLCELSGRWLLPRADVSRPCYMDNSDEEHVLHLHLFDNTRWEITERVDGSDTVLAWCSYTGYMPKHTDRWQLQSPLGQPCDALTVHQWSWAQYEKKKQQDTVGAGSKFAELAKQIRELKNSVQDAAEVKKKVEAWDKDRTFLQESIQDLSETVVTLKRRQEMCEASVQGLQECQRSSGQAAKRSRQSSLLEETRWRSVGKREELKAGSSAMLSQRNGFEACVVTRRVAGGAGYYVKKKGARAPFWVSSKDLLVPGRDHASAGAGEWAATERSSGRKKSR